MSLLTAARNQERVIVTLDTDFGELLARGGDALPSVILIRRADHQPGAIADVIVNVIASSEVALLEGALAVGPCACACSRWRPESRVGGGSLLE